MNVDDDLLILLMIGLVAFFDIYYFSSFELLSSIEVFAWCAIHLYGACLHLSGYSSLFLFHDPALFFVSGIYIAALCALRRIEI